MRRFGKVCQFLIAALALACASSPQSEGDEHRQAGWDIEQPDTPAGRCAFAYIEAFNSGDKGSIRAFWRDHGGVIEEHTLETRISEDTSFHKDTGTLTPVRIVQMSPYVVVVQTRSENGGAYWLMDFHVSTQPPHNLTSNTLTGPVYRELSERDLPEFLTAGRELRRKIVDKIAEMLRAEYVFPDKAETMAALIRNNWDSGEYDELTGLGSFTERLTKDLRSVYDDGHLIVAAGVDKEWERGEELSREERRRQLAERRFENFGFHRVERLPGNIGYLDLRRFSDPRDAGDTAVSAMNFLAHCDALIIDLRKNLGGMSSMEQLIASYFFERPTHLISFYQRGEDSTRQYWTHAQVQGPRMAQTPLYLVLGPETASSAEAFAYSLKHLERAILVGETTSGSAHGSQARSVPELSFTLHLPLAQPMSPVTHANWEGTGVEPHVMAPAAEALHVAQEKALTALLATETDGERKQKLEWVLEGVKAERVAKTIDRSTFDAYVGEYESGVKVRIEGGALVIEKPDHGPFHAVPMGGDRFMTEDRERRVRFVRDESGTVNGLHVLLPDGRRIPLTKVSGE